ncbi:lamin tail domain-containing protein [Algoriphagus sp.]|uniref:lamin tail domain-containing protein n=1 Tax=Algoriphagus sp. TaxID=1872435 RepID=UPI00391CD474
MKKHFLRKLVFISLFFLELGTLDVFAQKQDFEANFDALSFPEEFLPGWYGNEVRTTPARIFQISGQGRNGSKALAVQPISTFDGKIWVRLIPSGFKNPELVFFAKTIQNGSGNRPALVFYSLGESLEGDFSQPIQIGTDQEFANENRDFRRYSIDLPPEYKTSEEVFLSLEIRYGAGSGSAARWIMDDFEFGDLEMDETPPTINTVKGYDFNSVQIQFSEKVDPVFSILTLAYVIESENPISAQLRSDSIAIITFGQKLESGKSYPLTIRQIPDLEGNFLQDTTVNFTFFDPTAIPEKSLVINEIMPAPRADQDLPNVEYIEIFHAGENEFRLEGLKLANSRTETNLGEFWVSPGDHLILAPENQALQFSNFGSVLPVKSWPTLLNSGDQISLKSANGDQIDRISYATSSWGGSEFANGGYSLEVPNPFFLCDNSFLLRRSVDRSRGTPGAQNSIFNQSIELPTPKIETAFFRDSLTVFVKFSSPILPNLKIENLEFAPFLDIKNLSYPLATDLLIFLNTTAERNLIYNLTLKGLSDCFGQDLEEISKEIVYPIFPKQGDLIINEVLADPRTGDPKFVELKNTSQSYLNLEGWALANLNSSGIPDQIRVFGNQGLILPPESYLAITTNVNALKFTYPKSSEGNFLQIPTLPSYPIGGGNVVLLFPNEEIAEIFKYNPDFHHPLLRDSKGVSLERISAKTPASVKSNWQSASGNEDYATPGRKNSQALDFEFESNIIQIDPEIFDPEGSVGAAFTSIRYQLDRTGWIGSFKIYSAAGQLIQTLAQNQILGTEGLLTWTGTDSTGKLVRAGYYILVVELYEPTGAVKLIKKTMVVATRL